MKCLESCRLLNNTAASGYYYFIISLCVLISHITALLKKNVLINVRIPSSLEKMRMNFHCREIETKRLKAAHSALFNNNNFYGSNGLCYQYKCIYIDKQFWFKRSQWCNEKNVGIWNTIPLMRIYYSTHYEYNLEKTSIMLCVDICKMIFLIYC